MPVTTWLALLILLFAVMTATAGAQIDVNQTYFIKGYSMSGSTALGDDMTQGALTNAVGPAVSLTRICRAVAALRRVYQEHGYLQVRVSLPEQPLTDGIVRVNVTEGNPSVSLGAGPSTATNTPVSKAFEVRHFEVTGNTLLSPQEIDKVLQPATGPAVTLLNIRQAATNLRRAYRDRGFVTVAVSLPAQRITNATVRLAVTEGKLTDVQITGNRYFSSENILRTFPDLPTNTVLNGHVFQRELDAANQNRDRQIYPTLGPGPEPGTSALVLRVQDRLALHAHLEITSDAPAGTPDWRVNAAAQYNNFFQREQSGGLSYSFSPQQFKTMGNAPDYAFNQPLISSYSGFYRIPLPASETLGERLAASPRFGYQEATHQFILPPAQSVAELDFYASASTSDTGVKWSPATLVNSSPLLTIVSRDSAQSVAKNENIGSQFRFPVAEGETSHLAGWLGLDFKHAEMTGVSTNNFFISTTTTNQYGAQTTQSVYASNQPPTRSAVFYLPVSAGLNFSETDKRGATAADLALVGNFLGSDDGFGQTAYSTHARAAYGKVNVTASRDEKLPVGGSLLVRANGQVATGALIGNEQFALGGVNSVRGYYEGDQYGDCGWTGSVEWRSPYWETSVAETGRFVPAWLRASLFMDVGQKLLLEPGAADASLWLWGTGFGLSANVNNCLDARLILAWPLLATPNTARGDMRANFSIGGQF